MLSYLSFLPLDIYEHKLNFLLNMFKYTNFSNFLLIFESKTVVIIAYVTTVSILAIFFLYFAFYCLIKLLWKHHVKVLQFLGAINGAVAFFFNFFFWILLLPFLEILMNPLSCELKSSYIPSCSDSLSSLLIVPSLFCVFMVLFMGLLHIYIHCNYKFLDLNEIRLKFSLYTTISFAIRCSFPLFFSFFSDNTYLYFILLHCFFVISLMNFLYNFPIRSPFLSSFYLSLLLSFEAIVLTLTFWKYFNILLEESLFFTIIILIALCFKLGFAYSVSKRYQIFLTNFAYKNFVDYALEEMYYLFNNHQGSTGNFFIMLGMLKFHAKICEIPACKLKSKTMKKFLDFSLIKKNSIVNSFILQRFTKEIELECKNKGAMNEILIFKYISYLIHSNSNTSKAFYETQKIKLLYQHRTFFGGVLIKFLLKKVQRKIIEIEKEKSIDQKKNMESNLEVSSFFRISRQKSFLEEKMKKLLQIKIHFWETYKEGFDSYDELLSNISHFFIKLSSFEAHLQELSSSMSVQQEKIVLLRIWSIFSCIILNQLPESVKLEEKIDNIKKRFLHIDKEKLSPVVFLKDNLVICEASFLNRDGKILDSSKKEKLAKFFGYTMEDLKQITSINMLMPNFIAEVHTKLIFWSFVKTRKDQLLTEWEIISHGINKEGFIFPLKIFLGFNLSYKDDYVANAAMMKLEENGNEEVLINEEGMVLGFNREFFTFFKKEYPGISNKHLESISLYSLVPRIRETIENDKVFKERKTLVYRNMICTMILPQNLLEIIELLLYYSQEFLEAKEHETKKSIYTSSMNTYRTNRSNNMINTNTLIASSNSNFRSMRATKDLLTRLSNFINKLESLKSKKDLIVNLFKEHTSSFEVLMNKMMELQVLKKSRISIDLSFRYHRYGKDTAHVLSMARVIFTKIYHIEKPESEVMAGKKSFNFDESIVSNPFTTTIRIVMPPNNEVEFGLEFERILKSEGSDVSMKKKIESVNEKFQIELKNEKNERIEKKHVEILEIKEEILASMNSFEQKKHEENLYKDKFQKISIKSSLKSSDEKNIRLDALKLQTTEQFVQKEMELDNSVKSSSTSTGKKAFNVLLILSVIQKKLPRVLSHITYLLTLQLFLILIYCIIYHQLAGQYVPTTYIPLRTNVINQLRINQAMARATTVFCQFESSQLGFSSNLSDFKLEEMYKILNDSYTISIKLFYEDRDMQGNFGFSSYLQDLYANYVDYNDHQPKSILISDFTDIWLNVINLVLIKHDLNIVNDIINVLQRNYLSYLDTTKILRDEMQESLMGSNELVTAQLIAALAVAVSLIGLWKFLEFFFLMSFYKRVTRLLNIFLRSNATEAINEIFFLKEVLETLKDQSHSYMMIYFSDKLLSKRNYAIATDEANNLNKNVKKAKDSSKKKLGISKKHHISSSGLKPFSNMKILMFLCITGCSSICYFVFDYYFWTTCNTKIESLLQKTTLLNNLFIFSATLLTLNNLNLREEIIRDPLYEATLARDQIHEYRMKQLELYFNMRLISLEGFIRVLPENTLSAEQDLQDANFSKLIEGNICEILEEFGLIDKNINNFCLDAFNGAFKKGLLGVLNEYLNYFKSLKHLTDMTNVVTEADWNKRREDIKDYINSEAYSDTILASYLVNKAIRLFYEYFSDYYLQQLNTNIGSLTSFIWIMCAVCLVFMFIVLIWSWRFLKKMYRHSAATLSLIPLEKLSFDEQTIFLIKSFYKDHF